MIQTRFKKSNEFAVFDNGTFIGGLKVFDDCGIGLGVYFI